MTMTKPIQMIMKTLYMTMMPNPTKAKKTKKMQTSIQAAMAVIPSTFGEFVVTMLKMLINTLRRRTSVRFTTTTMMMEIKLMCDITNFEQPIETKYNDFLDIHEYYQEY